MFVDVQSLKRWSKELPSLIVGNSLKRGSNIGVCQDIHRWQVWSIQCKVYNQKVVCFIAREGLRSTGSLFRSSKTWIRKIFLRPKTCAGKARECVSKWWSGNQPWTVRESLRCAKTNKGIMTNGLQSRCSHLERRISCLSNAGKRASRLWAPPTL